LRFVTFGIVRLELSMTIESGLELWEQGKWRDSCCALLPYAYEGEPNAMTIVGTLMLYGFDQFESAKSFAAWQKESDDKNQG
jgi:hypothetical protein